MKRVYLEITDACNLNCDFCRYEKGHNYMPLNKINDYLDQIKPFCNYIYLHIIGEPLLHPEFNEILKLLNEKDMYLQLVTNGTLLYKYPDILKHKCLRKISISLHSINNIDIDNDYFDTINRLIDADTDINIELRFYDFNNLDNKLNNYLNYLKNNYELDITAKKDSYRINEHTYIYYSDMFKWPDINDKFVSDKGYCLGGSNMIAINSKADVCICCLDPKAFNKIGNLNNQKLNEILNSEIYQDYLENIKNNKLIFELCQKCTYRSRFD